MSNPFTIYNDLSSSFIYYLFRRFFLRVVSHSHSQQIQVALTHHAPDTPSWPYDLPLDTVWLLLLSVTDPFFLQCLRRIFSYQLLSMVFPYVLFSSIFLDISSVWETLIQCVYIHGNGELISLPNFLHSDSELRLLELWSAQCVQVHLFNRRHEVMQGDAECLISQPLLVLFLSSDWHVLSFTLTAFYTPSSHLLLQVSILTAYTEWVGTWQWYRSSALLWITVGLHFPRSTPVWPPTPPNNIRLHTICDEMGHLSGMSSVGLKLCCLFLHHLLLSVFPPSIRWKGGSEWQ